MEIHGLSDGYHTHQVPFSKKGLREQASLALSLRYPAGHGQVVTKFQGIGGGL